MLDSLNKVETSLTTSIQGSLVANNNLANQNKPGYNSQVSGSIESEYLGNDITGNGAHLSETIRKANEFIYQNLLGEGTSLSYLEGAGEILSGIEGIFAETEKDGFSKSLEAFFAALDNLKATPEDPAFQEQLKEVAQNLVNDMQSMYKNLENQEKQLEKDVKSDIANIDKIVGNIAEINDMIARNSGNHLELLDRRDLLEKQLSKLVDIDVDKSNGSYKLEIGGTTAVLNDHAAKFSYGEELIPQVDRFNTKNITLNPSATNPNDKFEFSLNGAMKVDIKYGETVNGVVVNETNIYEALAFKINNNPEMSKLVSANIDDNGNIEIVAKEGSAKGNFTTSLQQFTDENKNGLYEVEQVYKDEALSKPSSSEIFLKSYDTKVDISSGALSAKLENLDTSSSKNAFQLAKDGLDTFAMTLVDITNKYIPQSDGSYVYGEKAAINSGEEYNKAVNIGLFSGSGVKDLKFNADVVGKLEQKDYDYLASISDKDDIIFGDKGQIGLDATKNDILTKNGEIKSSFSGFYQALTVDISSLKSDNKWAADTQSVIVNSINNSYDKLIKVNPDEEQISLLKYQATYEASARIATVIQDMISTMLNMVAR